jgi:hypothetical protein
MIIPIYLAVKQDLAKEERCLWLTAGSHRLPADRDYSSGIGTTSGLSA